MIELGKIQELVVVREKEFGIYLGEELNSEEVVLLPKKQVPQGTEVGSQMSVFIYRDSKDRLIATTATPKIEVGTFALLEVKDVGKIGAFLDMGLERDLLLPFKEQTRPVCVGDQCLVYLYIDKSQRLAATMQIYPSLRCDSPYEKDDEVTGIVYEESEHLGLFVAVDHCYSALIPRNDVFESIRVGEEVKARVIKVREDGKLDLSIRKKAHIQMADDASFVWEEIKKRGGFIPFTDKADPTCIKKEFGLSKNAFKRAIGQLLKAGKVQIHESSIELIQTTGKTDERNL